MEAFILIKCCPWKSGCYLLSGSKWHVNIEILGLLAELPPTSNRLQRRQYQPVCPTDLKILLCACGSLKLHGAGGCSAQEQACTSKKAKAASELKQ